MDPIRRRDMDRRELRLLAVDPDFPRLAMDEKLQSCIDSLVALARKQGRYDGAMLTTAVFIAGVLSAMLLVSLGVVG